MIKIRKKRIIIPFFSLILATILTFFMGCSCLVGQIYEDGFFIFSRQSVDKITLIGLTDKGLEQEVLVVPEYTRERRVRRIGADGLQKNEIAEKYGTEHINFNSEKLKRVYIPFSVWGPLGLNCVFDTQMNFDVFAVMRIENTEWQRFHGGNVKISSSQFFEVYPYIDGIIKRYGEDDDVLPANVTYYYNYEIRKNDGIYWIDDYDGELISYIPENPYRAGYTFCGWYKEPECINKWDFEKDIVPEKEITEDNTYIFKELKLYAKWI